jgi:hypothetical protein
VYTSLAALTDSTTATGSPADGGAYFGKVYKDDIGEFGLGMV